MPETTDTRLVTFVAAFASLGAGVIHFSTTPDHWEEWAGYGVFFLVLALFQVVWPVVVLRRPSTGTLGSGLAVNLASMALWGATRLWGPPMGPSAGVPEPVGSAGVLTVLLESVIVVCVGWSLLPRHQAAVFTGSGFRGAVVAAAVVLAALTVPGAVAGLEHQHGGSGHGGSGHHGQTGESPEQHTPGRQAPTRTSPDTSRVPAPTGHTEPDREPVEEGAGHDDGHSH